MVNAEARSQRRRAATNFLGVKDDMAPPSGVGTHLAARATVYLGRAVLQPRWNQSTAFLWTR
jgi:hypothetical protein